MFELNVTALIILIYFLYRVRKTNKRIQRTQMDVNFLKLKEQERELGATFLHFYERARRARRDF